jgi:DNA polymerase II small subunit
MSETERLKQAVNSAIAAGYQLDKGAFELLTRVATTENPLEIVNKAIRKLDDSSERPFFIERSFLEQVLKEIESVGGVMTNEHGGSNENTTSPQISQVTEGKTLFYSYAKDIDSDVKILEDPSMKLRSGGAIEDFLEYFHDRFKRMEKILRQRIDVKSAASVMDALRAQPSAKLKIIGMITEKRESKRRIILTVEDLQTSVTVLVPQNAPEEVQKKARMLLLDQVVCMAVIKTRSTLLIVEDIILPEIGQRSQHRAAVPVYAVLTSDIHVGSMKFQREAFNRFILWLNGKHGNERMREMASHVKYVLIAGDIVDGVGVYPNQVRELALKDVHKQYHLAAKYIEQIPDYIEVVVIPGNHDATRKAAPQPAIADAFLETLQESRKVYSLGNPCLVSIHNVEVLMDHGRSLDDVISTVPGMSHNNPERAMRLLLQGRHLAPVYGGKTMLAPGNRDFLVIEHIPDIFHSGHVHTLGYTNYRGVLLVNSGGWQTQTEYMRRLGLVPTPGRVPVINLQTLEVNVAAFD